MNNIINNIIYKNDLCFVFKFQGAYIELKDYNTVGG